MQEKKMNINRITYNAAITALAKSARKYSKDFAKLGITKLERVELWPKALAVLDQMKHSGIQPDGFCYSSAINCCGAEGRWKEACDLIDLMKQGGPKTRPNKIAYTAAIGK
jgi:pentatricopeptide repeat protein